MAAPDAEQQEVAAAAAALLVHERPGDEIAQRRELPLRPPQFRPQLQPGVQHDLQPDIQPELQPELRVDDQQDNNRALDEEFVQEFEIELNVNIGGLLGLLGVRGNFINLWQALSFALSSFATSLLFSEWVPFAIGRTFLYLGGFSRFYGAILIAAAYLEASAECTVSLFTGKSGVASCLSSSAAAKFKRTNLNSAEQWIINSPNILGNTFFNRYLITLIGYLVAFAAVKSFTKLFKRTRRLFLIVDWMMNSLIAQCLFSFKFFIILFVEAVVFPTFCGIVIFLNILPLLNSSLKDHTLLFSSHPFAALFFHWFVGFVFIFHVVNFISVLRSVLRPGVFWFIRDPSDPNVGLMQHVKSRTLLQQFKLFFVNFSLYFVVITLAIGTATLIISYTPNLLPLRLSLAAIFGFPLDLAIAQLVLPLWLNSARARNMLKIFLTIWLRIVASVLRLTNYFFYDFVPLEAVDSARGGFLRKTMALILRLRQTNLNITRRPRQPTMPQFVGLNDNPQNETHVEDQPDQAPNQDQAHDEKEQFAKLHGSLAGWHALLQNKAVLPPPVTRDDNWEIIGRPYRVPVSDSIPVVMGRPMVVPLTDVQNEIDLSGLSHEEREIYIRELLRDDPSHWTRIYLPPNCGARFCILYMLLFVTVGVLMAIAVIIPISLGRFLYTHILSYVYHLDPCRKIYALGPESIAMLPGSISRALAAHCQEFPKVPVASAVPQTATMVESIFHDTHTLFIGVATLFIAITAFNIFSQGLRRVLSTVPALLSWFCVYFVSGILVPYYLAEISHHYFVNPLIAMSYGAARVSDARNLFTEWFHCAIAVRLAWNIVCVVGRPEHIAQVLRNLSNLDDWRNIQIRPFLTTVCAPIMSTLLALHFIPGLVKVILDLPQWRASPLAMNIINEVNEVYISFAILLTLLLVFAINLAWRLLVSVVRHIRDDEYLIARVLHDLPDNARRQTQPQEAGNADDAVAAA